MLWLTNTFNNRELALTIWALGFVVWMACNSRMRASTRAVIKAVSQWKVLLLFVALSAYVFGCVRFLWLLGIWDLSALKDTIYWFLGTAVVTFVNFSDAEDDANYFRKAMVDSVFKVVIPLEFVTNLYVFPFWLELCLVPIVIAAVAIKAFADARGAPGDADASKPMAFLLQVYGAVVLVFTGYHIVADYSSFATSTHMRDLILPIQLTFFLFPFIYFLALFSKYESTFLRLGFFIKDEQLLRFAKRRIFTRFHLNLYQLSRWSKRNPFLDARTKEDVEAFISRTEGATLGQQTKIEKHNRR